jgi:FAD dependent oxidoreductase
MTRMCCRAERLLIRGLRLTAVLSLLASPNARVAASPASVSASYDVVVYGATAGGVLAAVAAAKEGATVALLEPGRHVGGMVSGGLGLTDMVRQQHVIGGYAREFFERVGRHYGEPVTWLFEPKVAEKVFRDWLTEAKVKVLFEHRLHSVRKEESRIVSLKTENGGEFSARVFIDSSYEGDVMKAAGVVYAIGRESRSRYGESLAGRRETLPGRHQFKAAVSPYDDAGRLAPYVVRQDDLAALGEGDGKIQAYCFRLCLTDAKDNQVQIQRPREYDPARFVLARNYLKSAGELLSFGDFVHTTGKIPNGKVDANSSGAVSTNLLGASAEYPDATYGRRQEIWNEHLTWTQGLIYYLQNDPEVPARIQTEARRWGLAKDEFVDTGHWPHQLYIREARRMVGEYVLTQHDLQKSRRKYDSIGMGGYNIDIREVQWVAYKVFRFPEVRDEVLMEGYVSQPVEPYEIPYRSLLPRQQEAENLLVTSCISASSVAYASFRMEPQYMIAGHSAGVAAARAARSGTALHKLDIVALQRRLSEQRQILSYGAKKHNDPVD